MARPFDILCYSGMSLPQLEATHPAILARLDALIPEPYVAARPSGRAWRGSDNQPLVPLSQLGKARYPGDPQPAAKRLQFAIDAESIWCIGIPARGDLATLETLCRSRGLNLGAVSWRA